MVAVNPQVYYDGAESLTDLGATVDKATDALVKSLWDTNSMSGTGDGAKKWATSYDKRAGDAIDTARNLSQALGYFAGLVALAGYNHDLANYNADTNPNKGSAPTKPASVPEPSPVCWIGAPASGGPGEGLVSGVATLMEKIHVHVPDGDTTKLGAAAKAWHTFAGNTAITQCADTITGVSNTLGQVDSPEIADLTAQLSKLKNAGQNLHKAADQLGTDCDTLKKPHDELRKSIKHALHELELALAVNLAITILADFVTAGIGVLLDGISVTKAAKDIDTCATAITEAVETAKIAQTAEKLAAEENAVAKAGTELKEVTALKPQTIEAESGGSSAAGRTVEAAEAPATAEMIAARRDAAREFYLKQGYDPKRIDSHLDGIDFTKPVEVETIPKGTEVVQYQAPGAPQGNYYAPPGTQPGQLGISPQTIDRATGNIVDKTPTIFVTTEDVQVLRSTAAAIDDTWSIPGQTINAAGGGTQFMTTSTGVFVPK